MGEGEGEGKGEGEGEGKGEGEGEGGGEGEGEGEGKGEVGCVSKWVGGCAEQNTIPYSHSTSRGKLNHEGSA